jgi:hypothetical protein
LSAAIDKTTVAVPAAERVADVVRTHIERLQQGLTAGV